MPTQLRTIPVDPSFFSQQPRTLVTWLGMAGALINARGTVVLIDPLITSRVVDGKLVNEEGFPLKVPNPIEADNIPRVDAVCYTHADSDHLGRETALILARRTGCLFYAPPPVLRILAEIGIPEERLHAVSDDETISLGALTMTVTPALHDWQATDPWQRGDCCGYLLRGADGSVWHPGDSRLIDELLQVHGVDVLFFDIAAIDSHLGPAGSAAIARSSGAKVMLAYHYGTFDLPPGSFASYDPLDALPYVNDLDAQYRIVLPGETIELPLA